MADGGHVTDRLAGLTDAERFAAIAVERATGAQATPYDIDGRQGVHDFTLVYPKGRTAAVEVTSHAGPGRRQLESLLDADDYEWLNPGAWAWTLTLSDPADLPQLGRVYVSIIAVCERYGAVRPDQVPWQVREADPALRWLETTSVSMFGMPDVSAVEGDRTRPVYVMPKGDGGVIDENMVGLDQAVVDLLAVPAVARRVAKVSRADADERHLFVSVDSTGLPFPVASALMGRPERLPPTSTITLPGRLTHVWLAPRYLHVLLGWTTLRGWQTHDVYG